MAAEVIAANGGWAVHYLDHKGQPQFLGRDGFWTKIAQAVSPWKSEQAARDMADSINKEDHPHKFR